MLRRGVRRGVLDQTLLQGEAKARYVAALFGRIAHRYDLLNGLMSLGRHQGWRRLAAQTACLAGPGPALDVATGTGDLAFALAQRPQTTSVVGLDFSPPMLALAQRKARALGLAGKVSFILGDALALPFPDGSFSCATSGFALRNVVDLPGHLAEMARVIRPGGRVVLLELTPPPKGRLFSPIRLAMRQIIPLMGQLLAGDREAYAYLVDSVLAFADASTLAHMLQRGGLHQVRYQFLGFGRVAALHWGVKGETTSRASPDFDR